MGAGEGVEVGVGVVVFGERSARGMELVTRLEVRRWGLGSGAGIVEVEVEGGGEGGG